MVEQEARPLPEQVGLEAGLMEATSHPLRLLMQLQTLVAVAVVEDMTAAAVCHTVMAATAAPAS